ncbi:hypothetical protein Tco_0328164 [Tanacetum coccineum]
MDSLLMGDERTLSLFRVRKYVPILKKTEDTSESNSENVLLSSDDSVTFSNPLFEFNDEYVSSDINPLFDEVLEDIECKDSYDSNLDESTFLVTLLSDSNKDECLTPRDDIEFLLHHDHLPYQSKRMTGKKIWYDAPIDEVECFDLGGDNDDIDAFLAIEVSTCIEEGYYGSKGDVFYLESLLNDDTLITFSPKSDPLHHEFTVEFITTPPRIVREHEDLIVVMMMLCRTPNMEEIEIFPVLNDSNHRVLKVIFDSERGYY